MSFKGTNLRLTNEDTSKGINGVSALSDIPDGYMLEAENVDLSEPGKVKKRAGYALHGCKLPVRTRYALIDTPYTNGTTFKLDVVPIARVSIDLYMNTGANLTDLGDSSFYQVDDTFNTAFVKLTWPGFISGVSEVEPITTDTILQVLSGSTPVPFRPIRVYDDGTVSGVAKFLLPWQVANIFGPPAVLSDLAGYAATAYICRGFSPNRLPVDDILSITTVNLVKETATITFTAGSSLADLPLYTILHFETCIRRSGGTATGGMSGILLAKTATTLTVELHEASTGAGTKSLTNLSILYTTAKHLMYVGANPNRAVLLSQSVYNSGTHTMQLRILDCNTLFSIQPRVNISSSLSLTVTNEIGFLYGTEIDIGYVNLLNKIYKADIDAEVLVTGYQGSLFVEQGHPTTNKFRTVTGLAYTGVSTTLYAANGKFNVPITNAGLVYKAGDVVTFSYSTDTLGTLVTNTFTVDSVTTNNLYLVAGSVTKLVMKKNTFFKFTRTSSLIVLASPYAPTYYFNGLTVQNGDSSPLNPVYQVVDTYLPATSGYANYIELDSEVEWSSDSYFSAGNIFYPVFPEGLTAPINTASDLLDIVDYNSIELDRSVVVAARENGMWRYNGSQLLNMRIPRPPSGLIRNVPGTNGYLGIDRGDDGLLTGRQYDFIVTYSYAELVNGKVVTYESGISPVGAYSIVSTPALDLSGDSQLVELQVPTIPLGIGLPATSIFINVYRTPSGKLATQATSEPYLLERQVVNNPYLPYQTILAGTEAPLLFTAENYKTLYASVQTDTAGDELAREIIDPPLAAVVTSLENRVIAANGGEQPYLNLICKNVFNSSTGAFSASALLRHTPLIGNAIDFAVAPLSPATTTGTAINGLGSNYTFQAVGVDSYSLSVIAYTDNSHLFRITGATIVVGTKYLLRFSLGKDEAFKAGTKDPYYDGFGFEIQTFVGTNAGTAEVSAQKKWISKDSGGTVVTPAETFIVFEESQKVENIATDNGLIITGTAGDSGTESDVASFKLYVKGSATTYAAGDFLILKGLGTTGQIKDADGAKLDFDTDIICEVLATPAPVIGDPDIYQLAICVMSNDGAGATAYKRITPKSAISVSNTTTAGTHPPFTIYKRQNVLARAVTNFSLPSANATLTITTTPALTINANDDIIVENLPTDLPKGSGADWNRKYKAVSYNAGTGAFTVAAPKMPEELRGTVGATLASGSYGKLTVPKNIFSYGTPALGTNYLRIELTRTTLAVSIAAGDWVYIIVRGRDDGSTFLPFTGWFKIASILTFGSSWPGTGFALIGTDVIGIEVDLQCPNAYLPSLDFSTLIGVSETKVVFCDPNVVVVPVPTIQRDDPYVSDLTGTLYGPADGFTALEKVARRFAHAVNFVLHNTHFAYWGGRRIGNEEKEHPGNVLPTNGIKIFPHMYPVNKQAYRYTYPSSIPTTLEPPWKLWAAAGNYRVEGSVRSDSLSVTSYVETYTAKEVRPSRIWYTNPTGNVVGQAFRELSFDDVESQDGEGILALAPMQTFGLLFKKSSSWRIAFNNGATLVKDRIPSIVGAASAKNVVATPKGAFVLHDSGIYITDGGTMEDVLQPSRIFRERVAQNVDILQFSAGYHNPFTKTVYLGVPLSASKGLAVSYIDGQFVFNYSNRSITLYSIDTGWSINTNFPATFWTRIQSDSFFSSTSGKIFRLRRERTKTAYSDERNAISFKIRTRYVDSQDPVGVRFYRSVFFQFGTETTNTMQVAISYDFGLSYAHISSFTVDTSEAANAVTNVTLNDKAIDVVRRTPPFPRAANISLQITNEELDTAAEVHGIFFESSDGSTKLVSQPGT